MYQPPKEWPDYYVTPSRDFTRYTRDYEARYWNRETAIDWDQNVSDNLRAHLLRLPEPEVLRLAKIVLPLVARDLDEHIGQIGQRGLPLEEGALKAIAVSLPQDRDAIRQALAARAPIDRIETPVAALQDGLAILERETLDLSEDARLGLFRTGAELRQLANATERKEQARQLSELAQQKDQVHRTLERSRNEVRADRERLLEVVQSELAAIAPHVLGALIETRALISRTLVAGVIPDDPIAREQVRDLLHQRQVRGLTDIANHALVVEQSAIAPLSMAIILYRRRREIQEAMTTFAHDEAKHSAVFRRFLAEKMGAKERIPAAVIQGGERYLWIARLMPSGAVFLAVIIEAIGGAFLQYFAQEEHMPDPLFRNICKLIAERDEKRHQELCSATYNELYRTGSRWEQFRNGVALRAMLRAAYSDKTDEHPLIQACLAFGLESDALTRFVVRSLSDQLATIGMCAPYESLLEFFPRPQPTR